MASILSYYYRAICAALTASWLAAASAALPAATEADWTAPEFHFSDGQTLRNVKFHYLTLGSPKKNAAGNVTNAVLLLHGTTNIASEFMQPSLAGELFGPGQPLDASRYFIIMPDGLGRGGSAKPSDGLKAKFPHYGYGDLVLGQYRLVTEGLGIHHLKLVLGVSMGGMNTWQWAERWPDMMDAAMPIACMPIQISGRNFLIRRTVIEMIRQDPKLLPYIVPVFTAVTQGAVGLQEKAPTFKDSVAFYHALVDKNRQTLDASDYLYGMEASHDYDPEPGLGSIRAKVMAVNFADDLLNPVELGNFERLVAKVPGAKSALLPGGNGHFSLLEASGWVGQLRELLAALP